MDRRARIWFVYERFEQLRTLLEHWGWEIVERGDLSRWNEQGRHDPVLGLVSIRGRRAWPLGGHVSFTAKEWWGDRPRQPRNTQPHIATRSSSTTVLPLDVNSTHNNPNPTSSTQWVGVSRLRGLVE